LPRQAAAGAGGVVVDVLRQHLPSRGFASSPSLQAATHLPVALPAAISGFWPFGHAHTPAIRVVPAGQDGVSQAWLRRLNTSPPEQPFGIFTRSHRPPGCGA